MERFDDRLKREARQEPLQAPQWVSDCVEDALANLPEKRRRRKSPVLRCIGSALAAMLALVILLPNVSAQAAQIMQDLPLVGPLAEFFTFRTYTYEDGYHSAQVEIPEISTDDQKLEQSMEEINRETKELTDRLIAQFQADAQAIGSEGHTALEVRSRLVTNTAEWFTLEVQVWEGSGSGNTYYCYYHINKKTGEIETLSDLFRDLSYVDAISREIIRQMRQREAEGEAYWVDSKYTALNFTAIDPDQNFYFDENGQLVIVFDKYQVAPGVTGTPRFTIPRNVYEAYLK